MPHKPLPSWLLYFTDQRPKHKARYDAGGSYHSYLRPRGKGWRGKSDPLCDPSLAVNDRLSARGIGGGEGPGSAMGMRVPVGGGGGMGGVSGDFLNQPAPPVPGMVLAGGPGGGPRLSRSRSHHGHSHHSRPPVFDNGMNGQIPPGARPSRHHAAGGGGGASRSRSLSPSRVVPSRPHSLRPSHASGAGGRSYQSGGASRETQGRFGMGSGQRALQFSGVDGSTVADGSRRHSVAGSAVGGNRGGGGGSHRSGMVGRGRNRGPPPASMRGPMPTGPGAGAFMHGELSGMGSRLTRSSSIGSSKGGRRGVGGPSSMRSGVNRQDWA